MNYKKIDESDELLSEDLKLENEWQQVSTCSEIVEYNVFIVYYLSLLI